MDTSTNIDNSNIKNSDNNSTKKKESNGTSSIASKNSTFFSSSSSPISPLFFDPPSHFSEGSSSFFLRGRNQFRADTCKKYSPSSPSSLSSHSFFPSPLMRSSSPITTTTITTTKPFHRNVKLSNQHQRQEEVKNIGMPSSPLIDSSSTFSSTTSPAVDNNNSASLPSLTRTTYQGIQKYVYHTISTYRTFLISNQFMIQAVQECLSNMVLFYAPIRKIDNEEEEGGGVVVRAHAEIYYAFLNLWALLNDALSDSIDFMTGNGLTSIQITATNTAKNDGEEHEKKVNSTISVCILRLILSIIDCIAPALEVTAYAASTIETITTKSRSLDNRIRGSRGGESRQKQQQRHHSNALQIVTIMERIKFLCKVGIVGQQYYKLWYVLCCHRKESSNAITTSTITMPTTKEAVGTTDLNRRTKWMSGVVERQKEKEEQNKSSMMFSSVGILQDGGLFVLGGEGMKGNKHNVFQSDSAEEEKKRIQKLLYVGKRTGRKVIISASSPFITNTMKKSYKKNENYHLRVATTLSNPNSCEDNKTTIISSFLSSPITIASSMRRILQSPRARLVYLIIGELFHCYRPLFWAQSCRNYPLYEEESIRVLEEDIGGKRGGGSSGMMSRKKNSLIKSWIISLLMDVISHKLTIMGTNATTSDNESTVNIASEITNDELYRRKMRWVLFLLRAPIWNLLTFPVVNKSRRLLSFMIPLVGRPLGMYIMDMLIYWQKWHFMLD